MCRYDQLRGLTILGAVGLVVVGLILGCSSAAPAQQPAPQKAAAPAPAQSAAPAPAPAPAPATAQTKSLRPFTFILDFLPYGEYAAFYTALEKGFYKEEGLDVRILRGTGPGDTIKRIAAGQGDAGTADFSTIVALRANEDTNVKAISAYVRETWLGFWVRADSGINTPKDLEGKTSATTPGNGHQILFPLYAQLAGIKSDALKWVTMDATAMGPALITKQVDVAPFSRQHGARLQKQAKEQGQSLKFLGFRDVGMNLYGISILARDENIVKEAETLRAFIRGSIRGMKYAWDSKNVEEGARYVVGRNPEVELEAAVGAADVASQYGMTDDIKSGKLALGQFDPERVRSSIDIYEKYLNLKRKVQPDQAFTNELLPEKK